MFSWHRETLLAFHHPEFAAAAAAVTGYCCCGEAALRGVEESQGARPVDVESVMEDAQRIGYHAFPLHCCKSLVSQLQATVASHNASAASTLYDHHGRMDLHGDSWDHLPPGVGAFPDWAGSVAWEEASQD